MLVEFSSILLPAKATVLRRNRQQRQHQGRNGSAAAIFGLPPNRVVELGTQVEM
jgi:hypothetical protein